MYADSQILTSSFAVDPVRREMLSSESWWVNQAEQQAGALLHAYAAYRQTHGLPERSFAELAEELSALGLCLKAYGAQADGFSAWATWTLYGLEQVRARLPQAERMIIALQASTSSSQLPLPTPGQIESCDELPGSPRSGLLYLREMIFWLQAQGCSPEAERFEAWRTYLKTLDPCAAQVGLAQALTLSYRGQ